ncbi:MAG: DNA-binding response regulator [Epsilonproteobacteria bacterium]|nr:MAG: DNA-binding response regulator [Campylobacterota bacterium]
MQIENIDILVAEDEDELREYLVEYLQIFFKHVYSASSGDKAYKLYLSKKPDIILTDINMPNLDGLSMVSKIRLQDSDTKIIVMSAYSDTDKLLQAVELNLIKYLIKPIDFQVLKELLFDLVRIIEEIPNKIYLNSDTYWDSKNKALYCKNMEIDLKDKEIILMELLLSETNIAFSNEAIFSKLYNNKEKKYSEYAITSMLKRLRAKIPTNIIQNEYGAGYKILIKN